MEILIAIGLILNAATFFLNQSEPEKCLVQVDDVQSWQPCTQQELDKLKARESK